MMTFYYVGLESRSHAFLLERRMAAEGVVCVLSYMPRELMKDLCNLGLKFHETELNKALAVLYKSGLPGWHLYKEIVESDGSRYCEVEI